MLKKLPSGMYFIVMILFFTPWWSAGCAGERIVSLTGVQTLTGFKLNTLADSSLKTKTQQVPPDPMVILVAILALAALITGLNPARKYLFRAGSMGFAAAVLLLIFKARVDARVLQEGQGIVRSVFESGFWATVICLFGASIAQLLIANQIEPAPEPAKGAQPAEPEAQGQSTSPTLPKKSRAVLIPTEPPPSKAHNDHKYMPPAMRAQLDKDN